MSLGPYVIMKLFPKDLGMGVGVGNAVIGVRGRNMTSAQ